MKTDFHNDRRLMAAGGAGGSAGDPSITEARRKEWQRLRNAYNTATDEATRQRILEESIAYARRTGLLQAGSDAANKLQTVAGELEAARATQSAGMGAAAGNADIALQQRRGDTVIGAENTESTTIFQSKMQEPTMVRGIFGSIKMFEVGICAICKLFGHELDTSEFDRYMDELKAKFIKDPSMRTDNISGVDTTVSSRGAEANVNGATDRAQGTLQTVSPGAVADMFEAVDAQINGTVSPGPRGQTQQAAMAAVTKLVGDNTLTQEQGRDVMTRWITAAKLGGDKATIDTPAETAAVGNVIDRMIRDAAKRGEVKQALGVPATPATPQVTAAAPRGPSLEPT